MQLNREAMDFVLVHHMRGRVPSRAFERMIREETRKARLRDEIEKRLLALTPFDAKVICLHFGLLGYRPIPDVEIAELIGADSVESIRKSHRRSMRLLRKSKDIMALTGPFFV